MQARPLWVGGTSSCPPTCLRTPACRHPDIQVEWMEQEGPVTVRLTKRHAAYEKQLGEHRELCSMQRGLLDLLLPCLVLALPCSGGSGSEGPRSARPGVGPPPAKAPRRSARS